MHQVRRIMHDELATLSTLIARTVIAEQLLAIANRSRRNRDVFRQGDDERDWVVLLATVALKNKRGLLSKSETVPPDCER